MIDWEARHAVREAVDLFTADRITAFAFDDRLHKIKTDDETVRFVVECLGHGDEVLTDYLVRWSKENWDLAQRMLLMLESGAEYRAAGKSLGHFSQICAAVALGALIAIVAYDAENWLFWSLMAGGASLMLHSGREDLRTEQLPCVPPDLWRAWPFPDLDAVRRAMTRAPAFRKQRHRPELVARRRPNFLQRLGSMSFTLPRWVEWPLSMLGWRLLGPLALIGQTLPVQVAWREFHEPVESEIARLNRA